MGIFDNEDDVDLDLSVDESEADLLGRQKKANDLKGYLGATGSVLQGFADVPSSHEMLYNKGAKRANPAAALDKAAGMIQDPMETKRKAMEYMKLKRESAQATAADSIASPEMVSFYEGVMPSMKGRFDKMTEGQIDKVSPVLMAQFRAQGDERMARMAAERRNAEMADDRQFKLAQLQSQSEDRKEVRDNKQKELSSTQAKQRGLYESGAAAEQQYNKAVSDKNEYDPTSVGQVIDNSDWAPNFMKNNKAIEAQAAQSAWIEGFLRDASGAAIPPNERAAYAKDFFPQPGDPPDVVANKNSLRQQKMRNAAVAAGVESGHGPAVAQSASSTSPQQLAQQEIARRQAAKNTAAK